jgi:hypothetical protein
MWAGLTAVLSGVVGATDPLLMVEGRTMGRLVGRASWVGLLGDPALGVVRTSLVVAGRPGEPPFAYAPMAVFVALFWALSSLIRTEETRPILLLLRTYRFDDRHGPGFGGRPAGPMGFVDNRGPPGQYGNHPGPQMPRNSPPMSSGHLSGPPPSGERPRLKLAPRSKPVDAGGYGACPA